MKALATLLAVVALAGCSMTPHPVTTPPPKPRITPPSLTSMAECQTPVKLAKGPLTQQKAEIAWGIDDDRLMQCAARHKILANYIRKRDAGLTANAR